ncbi:putative ribonuclease H-like domain-containing protein [Rosa chinensis]|uniref:Putative ribonuclease H-like domain-containing protein n=1 Tax=Rosa chinensis TaxID=74649 RepID=A0A2P6S0G2_ROSCH|nr:putative ribonuclease H-like domain-containing protein [Rosa chinensis]
MHYFKLNVDGARSINGKIGVGGVLRDSTGAWVSGFYANLGCGSVLQAEAWGLLLGLQMAISHHAHHLLVESDSQVLVSLVQHDVDDLHPLKTITDCCQTLQRQLHSCDLKHVYREVNQVADILSKFGLDAEIGVHFMEQPPPQVNSSLLDDLCGSPRIRTINSEL